MSIFRWILDTRHVWRDGIFEHQAQPYLSHLRPEEQQSVLRFYHVKDRAMSLGSWLSKYLAISRSTNQPWSSIIISKDPRTHKPCYIPSLDTEKDQAVQFNVSHQAGIVALVGCAGSGWQLGIDVVCVHERDEYRNIDQMGGFKAWVDMHAEVFSKRELEDITFQLPELRLSSGIVLSNDELGEAAGCCTRNEMVTVTRVNGEEAQVGSNEIIEAKIRRFYAFWALKEAYVKMTGDALLADWLKEVAFRNVRAPRTKRTMGMGEEEGEGEKWGEVVRDVQIYLRGELVQDVSMELQAFEENYMVATAVSRFQDISLGVKDDGKRMEQQDVGGAALFPPFEILDPERDVMSQVGGRS